MRAGWHASLDFGGAAAASSSSTPSASSSAAAAAVAAATGIVGADVVARAPVVALTPAPDDGPYTRGELVPSAPDSGVVDADAEEPAADADESAADAPAPTPVPVDEAGAPEPAAAAAEEAGEAETAAAVSEPAAAVSEPATATTATAIGSATSAGVLLQHRSQGLLSSVWCRFSRSAACTDAKAAKGGKGKRVWRVPAGVVAAPSDAFVRRVGRQLWLRGKPFYVNGWNTYWLMYIASIPDKKNLVNQALSQGRSMGLTVCRTGAFYDGPGWHALQTSPGVFDENTFKALDYVIYTAKRFGIRLHMVLNGNWDDYGGKNQYVRWSSAAGGNPPGDDTAFFVDPLCRSYYKNFIKAVITRRNTFTGVLYRDDPTIFGWELINEPRVYADPSGDVLQAWITDMAAYVKSLDSNHLLSIGSEGFYGPSTPDRAKALNAEWWMMNVGTDFVRNNKAPGIDIASVHAYANSRYSVSAWNDKMAYLKNYVKGHLEDGDTSLNMPVLIGEFGPESITKLPDGSMARRNEVYSALYQIVLDSAKKRGSAAATMFWQLMADDLRSWDDGIAVFASDSAHAKTVSIICSQSKAIAAATRS
ncbi:hypothetical protein CLOM_g3577 [Closterium sp. NIES-68]|nr:hypothetical protein CLOM_g3577 [Closterium sp. NIES-68]GJP69859.1 hypothetical protein CLOP_g865 [Closterium sp. NIES-67]